MTLSVEGVILLVITDVATYVHAITNGVINGNTPCDIEIIFVEVYWLLDKLTVIVA